MRRTVKTTAFPRGLPHQEHGGTPCSEAARFLANRLRPAGNFEYDTASWGSFQLGSLPKCGFSARRGKTGGGLYPLFEMGCDLEERSLQACHERSTEGGPSAFLVAQRFSAAIKDRYYPSRSRIIHGVDDPPERSCQEANTPISP